MTQKDRYDNTLTCSNAAARDAYITGVDHLLSSTFGAIAAFEDATARDPLFAIAHADLARAHMMTGDPASARTAIKTATSLTKPASDRERAHIDILKILIDGDTAKARARADAHLRTYPRDAVIAQLSTSVFGLIAFSGCDATEAQMLDHTTRLAPHYGDDWWMMAVHAVSLCETGHPQDALELMEKSLAIHPHNANAAHFKAHALYEMGHAQSGLDYLQNWLTGYDRRAILHGHLNWHVALWALQSGDEALMWRTLDAAVAPDACLGLPINILTDTAALLWRAELAGYTVAPERWAGISAYAATHFPDPGQSFADIHSALAHAMAGNMDLLDRYLTAPKGYAGDLVAPLAQTWKSIVADKWDDALTHLIPVMEHHARLGGSRAQRNLIELTHINVALKLGKTDAAKTAMQRRKIFLNALPLNAAG